uniref:Uncharacterized protein n=1 Tax=Anopheles quadriannulatus TaxID=34691 RepID=A0A182XS23_ANOQN
MQKPPCTGHAIEGAVGRFEINRFIENRPATARAEALRGNDRRSRMTGRFLRAPEHTHVI